MITKSSVMEIQNLIMNLKSGPINSNSEQYLFKYVSSIIFQNEKPYFGVIFVQREFLLKTPAKYNCSGPPTLQRQRLTVDQQSNQNYSITISMQKSFNQSPQFVKSFVRYTWFKSPMINKALLIFDHAHPIITKVTFSFPKFISACKKSAHFIRSFWRYSRF